MAQILVIDDTKNIRKMVALTLVKAGHEIECAENGRAGLARFSDGKKWDLTLVDQQMPEMSGDEFVVAARHRDPMARLVMMTAFATPELAAQVIQSGALDFLRKPFTTEVLRGAVEVALAHPRHNQALSGFDPRPVLPEPGQSDYLTPRVSWRMNGFSFWPLASPANGPYAAGLALSRLFQIHAPNGDFSSCFVGVTPHVRAQIEAEVGHAIANADPQWDKLCGQTLLRFIAERAQTPPEVLPVYEVPKRALSNRGGLVTWGAFFGE